MHGQKTAFTLVSVKKNKKKGLIVHRMQHKMRTPFAYTTTNSLSAYNTVSCRLAVDTLELVHRML